jgi:hypothetical protein
MSNMEVELDGAEQPALAEAEAANAATNEEKNFLPSEEEDDDSSEVDSLLGEYSMEDTEETADNSATRKALTEMLVNNGFKLVSS